MSTQALKRRLKQVQRKINVTYVVIDCRGFPSIEDAHESYVREHGPLAQYAEVLLILAKTNEDNE